MMSRIIYACLLCSLLSGCALVVAGGAGYIAGRELEEKQGVNEPEMYK